jgi:DNA modification methylase
MLGTEADVVRTLKTGTYSVPRIYALCEDQADTSRDGGHDPVPGHPGDVRWKHRVRGALAALHRAGRADRIDRAVWAIQGTPQRPVRLLLIVTGATLAEFELRLQTAASLLASLEEPADLILCDPPWGLGRGQGHFSDGNGYRRDCTKVAPGYVDVDPRDYPAFTSEWVRLAAAALRPAGQLAVITGPQRAAVVQCAAEDAGLTWVTSIAAPKEFPIATLRRPSPTHWRITVMCRGPLNSSRRVFNPPADQPRARSGHPYPLDVWYSNGRGDRPGLYRYDNSLPLRLASRAVLTFSDPGDLVVDPTFGGGSIPIACYLTGRRFTGADVNPAALSYTGARLLDEHAWPALLTVPAN